MLKRTEQFSVSKSIRKTFSGKDLLRTAQNYSVNS